MVRAQCATPIAMGELYSSPHEIIPMIKDRLLDFIRIHISDMGGITPCRKLAAMGELFSVRTAWHGPGDTSPIGHAANLALDLNCSNFGIQEYAIFGERTQEVFPGCPEVRDGMMWPNGKPGLGIDINEELAAKFPYNEYEFGGAWDRPTSGWFGGEAVVEANEPQLLVKLLGLLHNSIIITTNMVAVPSCLSLQESYAGNWLPPSLSDQTYLSSNTNRTQAQSGSTQRPRKPELDTRFSIQRFP